MFFTLLYHHLGFRPHREEIKKIIEIDNDLEEASTKLNNLIIESDNQKNSFPDDQTFVLDNLSLHHAERHLEHADLEDNQKNATIKALEEEEV